MLLSFFSALFKKRSFKDLSLPVLTDIIITGFICLLIIILPFYDTGDLFHSYLTESTFLFIGIVSFIVFLRGISLLFVAGETLKIRISFPEILLFLFVCYIFLNRLIVSNLEGITLKQLRLVFLVIFYIFLRTLPAKYHKFFIYSLLVSGIIQAIYGNLQLWNIYPSNHNLFNITGSFFNPGPYAGYLSMIFPIALAIFLNNSNIKQNDPATSTKAPSKSETLPNNLKQPETTLKPPETILKQPETILNRLFHKYLPLITLFTILLVLPATRSRAAWLSTLAGSAYILNHYYPSLSFIKNNINTTWRKWLVSLITLLITIGFFTGIYLMKKDSADGRLFIWQVSSQLIKEKPLFGHGIERFQAHYMEKQAEYFRENSDSNEALVADDIIYPFNEFIKTLAELGIAGMIFIKRCIALPGDTLLIKNVDVYINGSEVLSPPGIKLRYQVFTKDYASLEYFTDSMNYGKLKKIHYDRKSVATIILDTLQAQTLVSSGFCDSVKRYTETPGKGKLPKPYLNEGGVKQTIDYFGPIVIPYRGYTIELNNQNFHRYKKTIRQCEGIKIRMKDKIIYIDDQDAETYTFQFDYYFMMGDHRYDSKDSRYIGPVPEIRIIGKCRRILFSNKDGVKYFRFLKKMS